MSASTLQKSAFIQQARQAMTALYEASAQCRHMAETGTDLGLFSGAGVLVDGDFINEAAGISAADFLTAGSTANAALSATDRVKLAKVKI